MSLRQLRGLRVQLLLWTILPLAVVLIVLSVGGITRHRQAMTKLVEDRDQSLTLAEANRLSRDLDRRTAALVSASTEMEPPPTLRDLNALASRLQESYPGGLATLDATGKLLESSSQAADWAGSDQARIVTARAASVGEPQYEVLLPGEGQALLLVAASSPGPLAGQSPASRALVGAIPVETLDLAESASLVEGEAHGAMFVLDAAGRQIHHHNPGDLDLRNVDFTTLPLAPPTGTGTMQIRSSSGRSLLVTYAPVDPPEWTLLTVEDVRAMSSMGISTVEVLPLLLLFVALVALLAVSFGVANVVRPLQELDRRAARVAWGDFDAVQQPVGGVQEMDDLRVTLAQMADRIRSYQVGMRDYLSAVTQAQEEERTRLARELHDDTVQALIALKQRAQMAHKAVGSDPGKAAARLDELEHLIDQELASVRRLISDLRPIYLEDLGFVPALEMLARQVEERHGLPVEVTITGETVRLAPDLELAAFRIVQQALDNVAAHAGASCAAVRVEFAVDGLTLEVEDDGRGFTPPDQPADLARQGHFGLMGMRERAMLYGGALTIRSAPGQGTAVMVRLPVR
jgi:signal transduction histidine kinase